MWKGKAQLPIDSISVLWLNKAIVMRGTLTNSL